MQLEILQKLLFPLYFTFLFYRFWKFRLIYVTLKTASEIGKAYKFPVFEF